MKKYLKTLFLMGLLGPFLIWMSCSPTHAQIIPTSVPSKSPDVNDDGRVNAQDILQLLANWGPISSSRAEDLDSNSVANGIDAGIIMAHWGAAGSLPTPTPTRPSTATATPRPTATPTRPTQATATPRPTSTPGTGDIVLKETGVRDGHNYWLYENRKYPCGRSGNHEFLVLQSGGESKNSRNLLVRFSGGAVGFFKTDGTYVDFGTGSLVNILTASREKDRMFNITLAGGLSGEYRKRSDWRLMGLSYCSHDLYFGKGQYNATDGFTRWGYNAAKEALDFVENEFPTNKIVTSGESAGSIGAFFHGINRSKVAGIIMDGGVNNLSAFIDRCNEGISVCCQSNNPNMCDCRDPGDGNRRCVEILPERIGHRLGVDEDYLMIQRGEVNKPIYLIGNRHDPFFNGGLSDPATGTPLAVYFFGDTHEAIQRYNPGGNSVSNDCLPSPGCNVHTPLGAGSSGSQQVYDWIDSL